MVAKLTGRARRWQGENRTHIMPNRSLSFILYTEVCADYAFETKRVKRIGLLS